MIAGMLGLMSWLNWETTLLIVAITPVLMVAISRMKTAVKQAAREARHRNSDILAIAQLGIESVRTVQALGAEEVEEARLAQASHAAVAASLRARRLKSLLPTLVEFVVAACMAAVMCRGTALTLSGKMTIGSLTVFLAYLARFFKPVQELAKMTNAVAQA